MNKNTKLWIIIAIFLILFGYIIFCSVMNKLKWDFTKLSTTIFEVNEYEINDSFKDIKIVTNTSDIEFIFSESSNTLVISNEEQNANHLVKVNDDVLLIEIIDTRKWYEHIGINFNNPKITIYLSKNEYDNLLIKNSTGDVKIPKELKFTSIDILSSTGNITNYASVNNNIKVKTSTGNISIENIIANTIDLTTSTGDINLIKVNCYSDIKINTETGKTNIIDTNCKNIISNGSTGDMFLKNVIANEKFLFKRSTGDIKLKDCDANDIFIKTDTGGVIGNLLTDKTFFVQSDTGSVDVPKVMANEKCEIITNTGDIKITID